MAIWSRAALIFLLLPVFVCGRSIEEKIGQLFVVPVRADGDPARLEALLGQIREYRIGGVIWMRGQAECQLHWINECRKLDVNILMMQDLEWGPAMRLEGGESFPKAFELGGLTDEQVEQIGYKIGIAASAVGIDLNLAPVADIDLSFGQSFLAPRCFGSSAETVSAKAVAYYEGMRRAGVLGCAKHFPGHGATDLDSHAVLPVVSIDNLSTHLQPFYALIDAGIPLVMVGHIAIDPLTSGKPASLSPEVVQGWLREAFGFTGVIITDALDMKGVCEGHSAADVAVAALSAGCDLLLMPTDLEAAYFGVLEAVRAGRISEERIDESLERIARLVRLRGADRPK